MKRVALIGIALSTFALPALGEDAKPEAVADPFNCMTLESFRDAAADTPQVRINNFSVREASTLMFAGTMAIEISYAVANRMEKPITISADFLLLDETSKPVAAINAAPLLNTVQPGKTETASGSTFVNSGTLKLAKQICLRVYSTWRQ